MDANCQNSQLIEEKEKKINNKKEINKEIDNKIDYIKEKEQEDKKIIYKKIEEEKDKFLRLFAEFENYKKRTKKEKLELFKNANQEVIISLIPILDDFERGILEIKKCQDENFIKGIELIQEKLFKILKEQGLKEIETKIGDNFNTDIHQAITQIPSPSQDLQGKIIKILDKGYNLQNKVIRHAKVIVGQ